ncbi:V-type ATP synthase subunit E [Fonticella tunisiensis]|uniref:Vacuolar-type H+-ATPase subunit E/Vma4 n=1 Tax=Fonticella tunisiensis TaxID=1096341 RepID=A0A4R7KDH2_9CLOT|nr:V-type ATP synthase subunit E [Fonticella tunisiensis]TDT50909.1 vacuolar-type H+-ATPase subunit E/Vma4 [Fonticella tunisiensis]
MITIEEKLKLFTKIVYDRVEKENRGMVEKFNEEFGNIIERKRQEFINEAQNILSQNIREIEKERTKILSRARIEEKRIALEANRTIFDKALKDLLKYAGDFTKIPEYSEMFFDDLERIKPQLKGSIIDIYVTKSDFERYKNNIDEAFDGKTINYFIDDELIGGFKAIDKSISIKFDMSLSGRINEARELIGRKLFEILQ